MAVLIGMSGSTKGRTFQLDSDMVTIGRSSECTIPIDNPTVSGRHCCVVRDGNHYLLRDLESTNGTRLNSKDVTEARLKPKDLVQAGSVEFLFDSEEEPTDAVEIQSFAETNVEIADGPVTAPDSFASISPFGTRRKESRGLWFLVIAIMGLLALGVVILFFIKLVTTS